jgi:hypothetical protein
VLWKLKLPPAKGPHKSLNFTSDIRKALQEMSEFLQLAMLVKTADLPFLLWLLIIKVLEHINDCLLLPIPF